LVKKARTVSNDETSFDLGLIQRQAAAVEEILYRKHQQNQQLGASNNDNSQLFVDSPNDSDDTEINEMLNRNLTVLLDHIIKRSQIRDQNLRDATLLKCLGTDRYCKAYCILQTIDRIGIELTGGCHLNCPEQTRLTKGSMPDPVRHLFCKTSLRTLMYFTPISHLHLLCWDDLLYQAERHILEYKEWSAKTKGGKKCHLRLT
jgi:hypothetical protein